MRPHWTEAVIPKAQSDIARAAAAMKGQLLRPVLRQPNIRDQVRGAIAQPEQYPADARQRLASMLYAKYGEMSRNILPYLGLEEEQ